ncbi:protease inhibitor I42 family protein [Gluconobacter cerinus]|uniref:protease inhibitor I42 family protein n=1 Tax=Gluconobacter cerinus TaxID=38307 RepID=UPI001B8BD7C0|nr:protease inhibitor I42 family protein [Gluconobacter cerinus]MBS1035666.1 protease inhibitor I42 family protein [Gluconobacter cerinus]
MIHDVPKGTSMVDAEIGRTLEFALPGGGTTGYRWAARPVDGVEVKRLPSRPTGAFGGAARDIFQVTPRRAGDISLQLELQAPWQAKSAETRVVTLRVR